jgi:hypothetical protein
MVAGCGTAGFFERVARILQPLADRPFSGLCSMLDSLAGGACCVFNGSARFCRSLLNGFASFFDRPLIFCAHRERGAK